MAAAKRAPVPAQKPPRAKQWSAGYVRRVKALRELWADHVFDYARRQFGRTDAAGDDEDLRTIAARLFESLGLPRYLTRAARKVARDQARYVQRVARIPVESVAPQATLNVWRQKNLDLIRSLGDADVARAGEIIHEIHARGGRWEDAAAEIKAALKTSDKRAKLIARDQIGKLNSDMQQHAQTSAGISRYRWSTTRSYTVRGRPGGIYAKSKEDHWALEGTIHEWANPPKIPGIAEHAHPGQRYNCECVAVPVVPWLDALGDGKALVRPAEIIAQETRAGFPRAR